MSVSPNFQRILLIPGYGKYSDRKIFYYPYMQSYKNLNDDVIEKKDINFNPGDGVNTTIALTIDDIYNKENDPLTYSYLVVCGNQNPDLFPNIPVFSRWFIMNASRDSKGIYTFTLKRDVVAEAIGSKFTAEGDCYIERGKLINTDPLIVQDEGIEFNQIKKREIPVSGACTDGCGWIVGYFANNTPATPISVNIGDEAAPANSTTFTSLATATGIPEATLTSMLTSPVKFSTGNIKFETDLKELDVVGIRFRQYIPAQVDGEYEAEATPKIGYYNPLAKVTPGERTKIRDILLDYFVSLSAANINTMMDQAVKIANPAEVYYGGDKLISLLTAAGAEPILYNGTYYNLIVKQNNQEDHARCIVRPGNSAWMDTFAGALGGILAIGGYSGECIIQNDWEIWLDFKTVDVTLELQPAQNVGTSNTLSFTLSASHNVLKDAPYSMFMIPYKPFGYVVNEGGVDVPYLTDGEEIALKIASAIATNLGANLYDIQLLPYAPNFLRDFDSGIFEGLVDIDFTENTDYDLIKDSSNKIHSIIFYSTESTFSFSLTIGGVNGLEAQNESPKVESNTDLYRLCSPNHNGIFEFNLAKNGMAVRQFNISCTYKPINPFIRVAPEFDFLYGVDFKDAKGLICGGDFSLPIVKDAWIQYEQQNKNYAQFFARDIQNLDFRQQQERFKQPFEVAAGVAQGAAGGALAGAKLGGGYGAAAGAAIGGGVSLAGGIVDIALADKRRAEERSYATDRFNLNIASIKALPHSLTKNSCLTAIYKLFPFIEHYTCTDEEKAVFAEKIAKTQMRVGRIDKIINYVSDDYYLINGWRPVLDAARTQFNFVKAQLIYATGFNANDHLLTILDEELRKGVYL